MQSYYYIPKDVLKPPEQRIVKSTQEQWQEPERSIDFVRHAMCPVESPTSG